MIRGQLKNRYVWKLTDDEWFEIGKKALKNGIYAIDEEDKIAYHVSVDSINDHTLSYTYWNGGFSGGCPGDEDEWYTDYYERDKYGYTWALTEKELVEYNERNETYKKRHCAYVKLHQYFFNGGKYDVHFTDKYVYYMEGNPQVGDLVSGDRYIGIVTEVYKDDPGAFDNYCLTKRDIYDNVYKKLVKHIYFKDEPKSIFERYNERIAKAKEILAELGVKKEC